MNEERTFRDETNAIVYYDLERTARKGFLAELHFHCLRAKLRYSLHCEEILREPKKVT